MRQASIYLRSNRNRTPACRVEARPVGCCRSAEAQPQREICMRWQGAAAALLVFSAGCYKATFIRDPSAVRGVEHDEWTNFFIFGLVNEQTIDIHRFCPD